LLAGATPVVGGMKSTQGEVRLRRAKVRVGATELGLRFNGDECTRVQDLVLSDRGSKLARHPDLELGAWDVVTCRD